MTATPKQEKLAALFEQATIIPVLTIERLEDAVPLARALVAGGVRTLEITLRTPVAIESAKAIMADVPDAVVGIGTILNADDLARAEGIGARFGISPGATPDLLKAAAASALPFAPGIARNHPPRPRWARSATKPRWPRQCRRLGRTAHPETVPPKHEVP